MLLYLVAKCILNKNPNFVSFFYNLKTAGEVSKTKQEITRVKEEHTSNGIGFYACTAFDSFSL